MRTTVTLDPDVERLLRKTMRERQISFKQALNEAIRAGIVTGIRRVSNRFVQKTFPLGPEQYFRWDKALSTADAIEDEEISRKLAVGK